MVASCFKVRVKAAGVFYTSKVLVAPLIALSVARVWACDTGGSNGSQEPFEETSAMLTTRHRKCSIFGVACSFPIMLFFIFRRFLRKQRKYSYDSSAVNPQTPIIRAIGVCLWRSTLFRLSIIFESRLSRLSRLIGFKPALTAERFYWKVDFFRDLVARGRFSRLSAKFA